MLVVDSQETSGFAVDSDWRTESEHRRPSVYYLLRVEVLTL